MFFALQGGLTCFYPEFSAETGTGAVHRRVMQSRPLQQSWLSPERSLPGQQSRSHPARARRRRQLRRRRNASPRTQHGRRQRIPARRSFPARCVLTARMCLAGSPRPTRTKPRRWRRAPRARQRPSPRRGVRCTGRHPMRCAERSGTSTTPSAARTASCCGPPVTKSSILMG